MSDAAATSSLRRLLRPGRLALVALLLAGGAAAAWSQLRPVPVRLVPVERRALTAEVMGTGTLEARVEASVGSKVAGRITEVTVDQGDRVEARQVLVRLDDADIRREVEVRRADVAAAAAAVERARADLGRAEAVLGAAQREHERVSDLLRKRVLSQIEADQALDALRVAEAAAAAARSGVVEAERRHVASEQAQEGAEARLAETVIRAPWSGLVVRRDRDPGDVVVPGSPILALISTDELWVRAWVDETEMGRLAVGQPARVVFRSDPEGVYPGEVARLGREVDRETREFVVDVRVGQLPGNWAVGQRAEAFVAVARTEAAVAAPARLVVRRSGEAGLFVHQEGRARWRPVTLGLRGREWVEVSEGLAEGEALVEPVAGTLRDGRRVAAP